MGNGKYGVELERSDYRTLEIGEGECVTPLPCTQPCPDWLSVPAVILFDALTSFGIFIDGEKN